MESYPKLPQLLALLANWQGEFKDELQNSLMNEEVIIRELKGKAMSAGHIFEVYFHRQNLQKLQGKTGSVLGNDNLLSALSSLPGFVEIEIVKVVTDEFSFSIFLIRNLTEIVGITKNLNNNKRKMLRYISELKDSTRRGEYYSNR